MSKHIGNLKDRYTNEIRAKLKEEFSYKSDMQIPKMCKIVLNMGVGEAKIYSITKTIEQGSDV